MVKSIISHRKFEYKIIQWEILDFCNYDCFYCGLHNNSRFCTNYKDVVDYLNKNIPTSIFPTIPQLFGGEPTIHPEFWNIVERFKVPFGIYTNLSKPIEFWKNLISFKNIHHIYCSCHYNSIKDKDEFEKKISFLSDELKEKLTLNIMLESTDKYLFDLFDSFKDRCICVVTKIPNSNINLEIKEQYIHDRQCFDIKDGNETKTYSSFQYDELNEINTFNFKCSTINFFNNIDIDGNITNYCRKFKITDIYHDEYKKIDKKFIICKSRDFCPKYCYVIGSKEKI